MAIEMMLEAGVGNNEIMSFLASINLLTLWTPDYFVNSVPPEDLAQFMEESAASSKDGNAWNYLVQLRAMMAHNVFSNDQQDNQLYARSVKSDVLVINFATDQMVNPAPGKELARTINGDYAGIDTVCGHMGTTCESARVVQLVHEFLQPENP
jgi:homoserine acetyltransferase